MDGDGTKNKGRLQDFLGFDRIWRWCYSAVNTHFSSRSREMTLKEIQRLSEPPPWFQETRWSLPKALGGGATPWSHRGGATWNPGGRNRPSRGQDPLLEPQGWSYVPVDLEGRVRTKQNYSQVLWSHGICLARFWPCLELITSFLSSDFSLLELECWYHPCLSHHGYFRSTWLVLFHRFTAGKEFCFKMNCTSSLIHTWFRYLHETLHFTL